MTTFISKKDFGPSYFEWDQYPKNIKLARAAAKENIYKCWTFMDGLESAQILQLHLRVAEVWKRQSGGVSFEAESALGKELCQRHLDDPFVQAAILGVMEGKEPELELQPRATVCRIAENAITITCADLFATTFTVYSTPDLPLSAAPYIAFACEAMSFTARHIPFSGNYSRPIGGETGVTIPAKLIAERTGEFQTECRRKCEYEYLLFKENKLANSFERRIKKAKCCKRTFVGNCTEISSAAFLYLLKKRRPDLKVDIFYMKKGNHAILVIGRDWNSNPDDITTWGPNAIVVDVWARKIYPASQILNFLEDFAGVDSLSQPILKKFDPSTQSLALVESNLYNAQEFKAKSSSSLPALEKRLKKLQGHLTHNQATKLLEGIKRSLFSEVLHNDALSSLVSQLYYFLELPSFDIMDLPLFHDLKIVELKDDPKMFHNAISFSLELEFGTFDLSLWMAKLTANPAFFDMAIQSEEEPTAHTFWLATLLSLSLHDIGYLQSVVDIGAPADEDHFDQCLFAMKKTNNLDFLRLFMQAGGKPSKSGIKSIVNHALRTEQLGALRLFDLDTDEGKWIVHYLNEYVKAHPISREFYKEIECFFDESSE
jgi:hypothetical protein